MEYTIIKFFTFRALLLIALMSLFSCAGNRPTNLGITDSKLTECPDTPNCVSSDSQSSSHTVSAFTTTQPASEAWQAARNAVLELPRTTIITESSDYLHAECTSAFFGFVDDLELHLRATEDKIAIRSASRLGSSDLGVNRKRVEALRKTLVERNIIQK